MKWQGVNIREDFENRLFLEMLHHLYGGGFLRHIPGGWSSFE